MLTWHLTFGVILQGVLNGGRGASLGLGSLQSNQASDQPPAFRLCGRYSANYFTLCVAQNTSSSQPEQ